MKPDPSHPSPYPGNGPPGPGEDPRPWWHKKLEEDLNARLAAIESVQRVQTTAFIVGAPAIAAIGFLAGRFGPAAPGIVLDFAAVVFGGLT